MITWNTDWVFKIHAYLHDPPDKPLALARRENHAEWARYLADILAPGKWDDSWTSVIANADRLASGADRSGVVKETAVDFRDIRHPLSGQQIDLHQYGPMSEEVVRHARDALEAEVKKYASWQDQSAAFIALWKLIPEALRARSGRDELGCLWDLLPADTRMPNHPVLVHLSLTSAIATILHGGDTPALLAFSIGPVQSFITSARRTSDLFAGSRLLSQATVQAMAPLVSALGPDHIVFPALRHSALFEGWLREESPWKDLWKDGRFAPDQRWGGLPNRFVAIVPLHHAASIGLECERAVRGWLASSAMEAGEWLDKKVPVLQGFGRMAAEQAAAFFTTSWSAVPWPADGAIANATTAWCERASWMLGGELAPDLMRFIREAGKTSYRPNGGILYGTSYQAVQRLQDAVKRTRTTDGHRSQEGGLKCSLCGERSVHPGAASFEEQKQDWRAARAAVGDLLRAGEALCGVCWMKRWKGRKDDRFRAPSTAEIAATPFKSQVLAKADRLQGAIDEFAEAVGGTAWADGWTVPELSPARIQPSAKAFASVSGEAFLAAQRDDDRLPDDAEVSGSSVRAVRVAAKRLRTEARSLKIDPPRPYLAVLAFDGDEMGKWLSGEKNRKLHEYLARSVANELNSTSATPLLDLTWPVTPSMHASLSEACSVFSQRTSSYVLHRLGLLGQLIYSGGDEVLAMVPVGVMGGVELATEAALQLRLRFSGHMRKSDGSYIAEPNATGAGFTWDSQGQLGLAFGDKASASAALVVFHQKTPLGRALREAHRSLDEYAKSEAHLNRNALAITIFRRSGQITRTGMRFLVGEGDARRSPVQTFQRICLELKGDLLSPRLVRELWGRLGAFSKERDVDWNLVEPLVKLAVARHHEGPAPTDLLEAIRQLGDDCFALPGSGDDTPLVRFLNLIEAAAFMARGEEP